MTTKAKANKTATVALVDLNETTAAQMQTEFEAYMKSIHIDVIEDGFTRHRDPSGAWGYDSSSEVLCSINLAFHAWTAAKGYNNVFLSDDEIKKHLAQVEALNALHELLKKLQLMQK